MDPRQNRSRLRRLSSLAFRPIRFVDNDLASRLIDIDVNFDQVFQGGSNQMLTFGFNKERHEAASTRPEQFPADGPGYPGSLVDRIHPTVGYTIGQPALELPCLMQKATDLDCQPPASSPASEACSRRLRALIRPSGRSLTAGRRRLAVRGQAPSPLGRSAARASEPSNQHSRVLIRPGTERQLDRRSIPTQRGEYCSNDGHSVGFRRPRWLRPVAAACERPHRSAASFQLSRSAAGDPSGRSLASARSRSAAGGPAPSARSRSAAEGRRRRQEAWERAAAGAAAERSPSGLKPPPGRQRVDANGRTFVGGDTEENSGIPPSPIVLTSWPPN